MITRLTRLEIISKISEYCQNCRGPNETTESCDSAELGTCPLHHAPISSAYRKREELLNGVLSHCLECLGANYGICEESECELYPVLQQIN